MTKRALDPGSKAKKGRVHTAGPPAFGYKIDFPINEGWSVHESDQLKTRIPGAAGLVLRKFKAVSTVPSSEKIRGLKLLRGFRSRRTRPQFLDADVLEHLMRNQELIPESWKGKTIFFFGTIYRNTDSNLLVRCLFWNGTEWLWSFRWLASYWHNEDCCAIYAR